MSRNWVDTLERRSRIQTRENIDEWGIQNRETLLLCMQEELGELTQANLQGDNSTKSLTREFDELVDLMALLYAYMLQIENERYGYEYDPHDIDISDREVNTDRRNH